MLPAQLGSAVTHQRAAQRRAVSCGAVSCPAVRCRATPYGAVRCRAAYCALLTFFVQVSFDEVSSSSTEVHHHPRFVRTTLLNHIKCSQLSSAIIAQQRAAPPCGAVLPCLALRCGAVPCCAVLRCAFFRTHRTSYYGKYQYQVPATVCTCAYSSSGFLHWLSSLSVTHVLPIRTWHRQQAHNTLQTGQSALHICLLALPNR